MGTHHYKRKKVLAEIRKKYGDDRRTEIIPSEIDDIDVEDMIADEDMVVSYSRGGYIKRQNIDNYRSQRRGGKGIKGMKVNEEDVVENIFIASTLDALMVFTSLGKVHWLKVYTIPDVLRTSKGKSISYFGSLLAYDNPIPAAKLFNIFICTIFSYFELIIIKLPNKKLVGLHL